MGERKLLGPEIVQQTSEKIEDVRNKLRIGVSHQKSYADNRRIPLEFSEGDHVLLRVVPHIGIGMSIRAKKLNPRYIGPLQILKRIRPVAYELALPPSLAHVRNVFHVSNIKKYVPDPSHILSTESIQLSEGLEFDMRTAQIVDSKNKTLRGKTIPLVKVVWNHQRLEEATYEREDKIHERYPNQF